MTGIVWYSIITIVSLTIFLYTLLKAKNKKLIALYTFLAGIVYLFEYFVLVLFKSYVYKPGILKNAYFDSILGAIVSDAFSVPMLGVFVAAFQLKWLGIILIIGIFYVVEVFFLYLNIYQHFWWHTPYTAVGLVIFFFIAKKWFLLLNRSFPNPVRFFTLYFTNVLIQATLVYVSVAFLGLYHYDIGWFHDQTRSHVAFSSSYIFALGIVFVSLVYFKADWKYSTAAILLTLPIDLIFLKMGILVLSSSWVIGYFFLVRLFLVSFLTAFNRAILK